MGKIIVIPSYSIPHPINGPKYVVSFLLNHGFPMLSVNCFLFFFGGKGKTFRRTPAPGTLATPFRTEPLAALVFPVAGLREKNNGKSYENPMKILWKWMISGYPYFRIIETIDGFRFLMGVETSKFHTTSETGTQKSFSLMQISLT